MSLNKVDSQSMLYKDLIKKLTYKGSILSINKIYQESVEYLDIPFLEIQPTQQQEDKLQGLFLDFVLKFRQINQQEFVCRKSFDPKKGQQYVKAFHCKQCSKEVNSALCLNCFEKQKHKDHNYCMIEVIGGCCDCGDDSKWERQTFCSKHKFEIQQQKPNDDKEWKYFCELCSQVMKIICYLYEALKEQMIMVKDYQEVVRNQAGNKDTLKNLQKEKSLLKWILIKTDNYGSRFFSQLEYINKNQYVVNCLTRDWMDLKIQFDHQTIFVQSCQIRILIMKFIELKKTAKACVKLLLLLFIDSQSQEFRQKMLITYLSEYSNNLLFADSGYIDLSAQLLNSSGLIENLQIQKYVPLIMKIPSQSLISVETMEVDVVRVGNCFKRFYRDLLYIQDLKFQAFRKYWKNFDRMAKLNEGDWSFAKLAPHRMVLGRDQRWLKISYKECYQVQQASLLLCLKVLQKMRRQQDSGYIKRATSRIFKNIFKHKVNDMQTSLYCTQRRMLSLFIFTQLYKCDAKTQQLDWLNFVGRFNVQGATFQNCMFQLARGIINNFAKIASIMASSKQVENHKQFAMTYFKSVNKPNFLFSLDAFLLKFVLNFLKYIKSQDPYSLIIEMINEHLKVFQDIITDEILAYKKSGLAKTKSIKMFNKLEENILTVTIFISLVEESILSNLPELVLISHFEQLLQTHTAKFMKFYDNILASMVTNSEGVVLEQFKKVTRKLFFKEEQIFKKYVETHLNTQNEDYLDKTQGHPINLNFLFSIRYKFNEQQTEEMFEKMTYQIQSIPFNVDLSKSKILQKIKYFDMMIQILGHCKDISQSYEQLINDIVTQLWKIFLLTKSTTFQESLCKINQIKFNYLIGNSQFYSGKNASILDYLEPQLKKDMKSILNQGNVERGEASILSTDYNSREKEAYEQQLQSSSQQESTPPSILSNSNLKRKKGQSESTQIYKELYMNKECVFGNQCVVKDDKTPLQWLCHARYTNMHSVFKISSQERILTISSCGHCAHRQCFNKRKQKYYKCRICHKNSNILIIADSDDMNNYDFINQSIIQTDLQTLQSITSANIKQPQSIQAELFRSIILFLLCNLVVDDFNCFSKNIVIYRSLFRKLKKKLQNTDGKMILQKSGKINVIGSSITGFEELIKVVGDKLTNRLFNTEVEEYKIKEDFQSSCNHLENILDFFQREDFRCKVINPSTYLIKETTISSVLKDLPFCLKDLINQSYKCQVCHGQNLDSYFLCLLSHEKKNNTQQYCICHFCRNDEIKRHLEEQHASNEALFVETDTGKIFYYSLTFTEEVDKQREIMLFQGESLYANRISSPFKRCENLKAEHFKLNARRLKYVENKLLSWKFADVSRIY